MNPDKDAGFSRIRIQILVLNEPNIEKLIEKAKLL
jgi:hypothetical protein